MSKDSRGGKGGGADIPFSVKNAVVRQHSETASKQSRYDAEYNAYSERFRNRYGWDIDKSMRSQQWSAARESIAGVERVLKMYPGAQEYLRGGSLAAHGMSINTLGRAALDKGYIQINDVWFKDRDTVNLVMNSASSKGFHPAGSTSQGVSTHEAGHLLVTAISRKTGQDYDTVAKDIVNSAIRNPAVQNYMRRQFGSARSTGQLRKSLSRYASSNNHETIAEAVSDYAGRGSQAHVLSRAINQELRKRLR